jgi:23S rRNA-/tRNA-specific pseudouridylate synthase
MPTTVAKPPGLPVFPPHDAPAGDCVWARLMSEQPWRGGLAWPAGFEGGIAHRLDTSTSGAIAVADDLDELERLRAAFAGGRLTKRYVAVTARPPSWTHHRCDRSIAHDARHKRRMVVQRGASTPHRGRWYEAHTAFEHIGGGRLRVTITTGVMHQIRVHAAFLGVPLVGDRLYGGGDLPPGGPAGCTFWLHHVGLRGDGWATEPVPLPAWWPEQA